jgi:hypothetical protein
VAGRKVPLFPPGHAAHISGHRGNIRAARCGAGRGAAALHQPRQVQRQRTADGDSRVAARKSGGLSREAPPLPCLCKTYSGCKVSTVLQGPRACCSRMAASLPGQLVARCSWGRWKRPRACRSLTFGETALLYCAWQRLAEGSQSVLQLRSWREKTARGLRDASTAANLAINVAKGMADPSLALLRSRTSSCYALVAPDPRVGASQESSAAGWSLGFASCPILLLAWPLGSPPQFVVTATNHISSAAIACVRILDLAIAF